uniref:Laccase n=1 Tax=Timema bartmani TaxID=61472 RepID=A0A7R9ER56_9NEOP|nr:unnamed protein product [Timema bartmani]
MDGPPIDVCQGDLVVIDVSNMMEGIEESMHWHGILQKGYQFMDGVPMLTQCPIAYLNIFRYKFRVPECGTFFYHSHSGLNKVNGIHGSFVVRCPQSEDIHGHLYDHDLPEHTIIMSDWLHVPASMHLPGSSHILNGIPENVLINGRGRSTVNSSDDLVPIPYTKFTVRFGERYRMRIINSGTLICPFQISVEDHNMTVIATDGEPCEPKMINTLTTYPGERYCVVIHANQPKSSYWIHVKPVGLCTLINKEISQSAILVYNSDQTIIPKTPRPNMTNGLPEGYNLNPPNCKSNKDYICVTELSYNGINDPDFFIRNADIVRYYEIKFVSNSIDNFFHVNNYYPFRRRFAPEIGTINDRTMLFLSSPPLSQPIDPLTFCNKSQIPATCLRSMTCACPHIESIDMGLVVDLIVVNNEETNVVNNHPMHLHGHSFFVLLLGRFHEKFVFNEKTITYMYASGLLGEKTKHQPPLKDTIVIPSHGFAPIRCALKEIGLTRVPVTDEFAAISLGAALAAGLVTTLQRCAQTTARKIERGGEGSSRRRHNGDTRVTQAVLQEIQGSHKLFYRHYMSQQTVLQAIQGSNRLCYMKYKEIQGLHRLYYRRYKGHTGCVPGDTSVIQAVFQEIQRSHRLCSRRLKDNTGSVTCDTKLHSKYIEQPSTPSSPTVLPRPPLRQPICTTPSTPKATHLYYPIHPRATQLNCPIHPKTTHLYYPIHPKATHLYYPIHPKATHLQHNCTAPFTPRVTQLYCPIHPQGNQTVLPHPPTGQPNCTATSTPKATKLLYPIHPKATKLYYPIHPKATLLYNSIHPQGSPTVLPHPPPRQPKCITPIPPKATQLYYPIHPKAKYSVLGP